MKKLLSALCLCLTATAFAGGLSVQGRQTLDQAVQAAATRLDPTSTGSHEDGVIPVTFRVLAKFDEDYAKENKLDKDCVAVRVSSQYLMASMACIGLSDRATKNSYAGAGSAPYRITTKVAYRTIDYVQIGSEKIQSSDIYTSYAARVILIRWNGKNANLKKQIAGLPIPNLFIPKNPASLKTTFSKVVVNRNRMPNTGRTTANVKISSVCSQKGCFDVEWKAISAQTGSPIFGLHKDTNQEFLLGFNSAEPDGAHRESGETYYLLTDKVSTFLQDTLEPEAFAKVQRKIVDETFFN